MISCYLSNNSPEKAKNRKTAVSESAVVSLTARQVQNFKIKYDDITLDNKIVNKIMLCGVILSYREGLSPTKKPIRILKFKDSTGICSLQVF